MARLHLTDALRSPAPKSEAVLMDRVWALSGRTVGEVGAELGVPVPPDQRRAKGLVGTLVEYILGADAGSKDEPDFTGLGIELKTLPLGAKGQPRESTFVCAITLLEIADTEWARSRARRKLSRVLWVPVESEKDLPLPERRFGQGFLWSPSLEDEAALEADWHELAGRLGAGDAEAITAHVGQFLQVRPKAAHGRVRGRAIEADGGLVDTVPKGFYLRTKFTQRVLAQAFG